MSTPRSTTTHYRRPGAVTRHVLNPLVVLLTLARISVWGSRVLEARGRTSGQLRRVPVNLLHHDGRSYLVAPRGETDWVRNVRADEGRLDLLLGRRRSHHVATELDDVDKPDVLRAYLARWKAEVGIFFDGVGADSSDAELLAIAPRHPVFVLADA